MKTIQKLADACKCSFSVTFNQHRDYYESVKSYLGDENLDQFTAEMEKTNTIVEIQAYPNTPVSFHIVYSHNLETAIKKMAKLLKVEIN